MKVKNLFGMAAMAALVLSGCSSDEVVENFSPENAIEFGTYVGRDAQSRGKIITTKELGTQGFGVFAYYTATDNYDQASDKANFMYNQKVTATTWNPDVTDNEGKVTTPGFYSDWTYTPVKYWPNNTDDKVTFFAYAPYDANKASNGITDGKINFTVNSDIKEQIDLLWNSKEHVDETKQSVDGTIDFVFSHALSRLAFTVQAAVDEVNVVDKTPLDKNTTITVHKVILKGENATDGSITGAFYTGGVLNLNYYSDDNSQDPAKADWTPNSTLQTFELNNQHFVENKDFVLNNTNSFEKNKLTNDDSFLMVIPQDFTSNNTKGHKLNVYIEYTVSTVDPEREDDLNNSTIENRITTEAPINFESGKAYSINLCLGMTSVKLEATVATWKDVEEEVDLPENFEN